MGEEEYERRMGRMRMGGGGGERRSMRGGWERRRRERRSMEDNVSESQCGFRKQKYNSLNEQAHNLHDQTYNILRWCHVPAMDL